MSTETKNQVTDDGGRNNQPVTGDDGQRRQSDARTLTSAELNAIIERRVGKEREKFRKTLDNERVSAVQEWRDEMGLDDDTLGKVSKQDEVTKQIRDLNKTIKAKDKEIESLSGRLKTVEPKLRETLTRDAVIKAAAGKAVDPEDVWLRAAPHLEVGDDWGLTVLQDGEASDLTVDKFVEQLLASHKHLAMPQGQAGAGSRGSPHTGGGNNVDASTGNPVKDLASALEEAW